MRRPRKITATFTDFRKIFILTVATDNLIHELNEQRLAQTILNPWCKGNWEIKCKW